MAVLRDRPVDVASLEDWTEKQVWNQDQRSTTQQKQLCPWREGWGPLLISSFKSVLSSSSVQSLEHRCWGGFTRVQGICIYYHTSLSYWNSLKTQQKIWHHNVPQVKFSFLFCVAAWIHYWKKTPQKLEIPGWYGSVVKCRPKNQEPTVQFRSDHTPWMGIQCGALNQIL